MSRYLSLSAPEFFYRFTTEESARDFIWREKHDGRDFVCRCCGHESYYQHESRAEIRECRSCHAQNRVRSGTIFERSHLPLLTWLHALYLTASSKRGISAKELQRQLGLSSYKTCWAMLHKIREALAQRDEGYRLKGVIEVDGVHFSGIASKAQTGVHDPKALVAIESKQWVDEKGRTKKVAGFAKVVQSRETTIFAQRFLDQAIDTDDYAVVHTDGAGAYKGIKNHEVFQQTMNKAPMALDTWLPWVHKFISNAKAWLIGTHHGIAAKYLATYLAEFVYRFNRRHDPSALWHRALRACAIAKPRTLHAITG